jgi:hypothetical protein
MTTCKSTSKCDTDCESICPLEKTPFSEDQDVPPARIGMMGVGGRNVIQITKQMYRGSQRKPLSEDQDVLQLKSE